MSGGGRRIASGGMSQKAVQAEYSHNDLKQVSHSLEEVEDQLAGVKADKARVESELKQLSTETKQLTLAVKKLQIAVTELASQQTQAEERIASLRGQLTLTPEEEDRIQELESESKSLSATYEADLQSTQALEAEKQALEKQIMDAGGSKLRTQKAQVEQLSNELDQTNKQITKIKVSLKTGQTKVTKLTTNIENAQTEILQAKEKVTQLRAEQKEIEEKAEVVLQAYKVAQDALSVRQEELKTIQTEYETLKEGVETIRVVEVDVSNRLDDLERQRKENKNKATYWSKKLNSVIKEIKANLMFLEGDDNEAEEAVNQVANSEEKEQKSSGEGEEMEVEEGEDKAKPTPEDKENEEQDSASAKECVPYRPLTEEELKTTSKDDIGYEITMLEEQLALNKPNMKAIQDYRRKLRQYLARVDQLDQTTKLRDDARSTHDGLRKQRLDEFMGGFSIITMKLKEMYQMLTLGGDAELELVDSLDPFSEGIVFSVRPPKKSWKHIQNLSGGEKTLSSLALVFALHHFKPTPLYVMDEIDAALDFKNVSIVANYIKERTKNAQFIIISLRNNMFELADRLVGIYKTNDMTNTITIDPSQFATPGSNSSGTTVTSRAPLTTTS